ncbi:MAG: S-layer homology domain-containing protein [Bacillota bacterium]|nr:S-layer homology domain-containing protein [Bacillota bacterium]
MRTKGRKRLLSALLVLMMVLSLMPMTALAEETPAEEVNQLVTDISQLKDGDRIVIYNPGHELALKSEMFGSWCIRGGAVEIDGTHIKTPDDSMVWTVDVDDDGNISFYQDLNGEENAVTVSAWLSGTYVEMSMEKQYDNVWMLESCNEENSTFYVYSSTLSTTYGHAYIETYKKSYSGESADVFCGYSTGTSRLTEKDYGMQLFLIVEENENPVVIPPSEELPKEGDEIVIYNASAESVIGMGDSMGASMTAAPATIVDGVAQPENGALVFTVHVNGTYYTFENNGKYLSSNDDENLFLGEEQNDYAAWTLDKKTNGYLFTNKAAKYKNSPVCIEYYAGAFSGWTYKSASSEIFEFNFYPVAEDTTITDGIVNKPEVVFSSGDAYAGVDYKLTFSLNTLFGYDELLVKLNGESLQFSTDNEFSATVTKDKIVGSEMVFTVSGRDTCGVEFSATKVVKILDEPVITNVTPTSNSTTLENKRPVISAAIINCGDKPEISMTVNNQAVAAVYENGVITYTPDNDMEDGKVAVAVTVTREDGKTAVKNWSFYVGDMKYRLYFGQLHSHTAEYSDGAGTLQQGLDYIKDLPESANVQFVAFTDHSNYFDASGSANPEQALYDMSVATAASREKWAKYNETVAAFNESQSDVIAIAGFEMTWSGGPGHINTFNTPGIVSRNNTTLNNKTSDAGMKAYYSLLSQTEGADSISQLNHPGTTFGNFSDFSYWDALIDSRVFLVEVGNGEGQIGAGGYYPSYEQYIMALDKGWHVAPTNNQDNHKGKWGNANDARDVILTNDFSEEGIYSAIRSLRVYSTEDKNLEIYYSINDFQLGSSIIDVPEVLNFEISAHDNDAKDSISKVEIVANSGKVVYTWDNQLELSSGELAVSLSPDYSYYFVRVTEGDGDIAVTAPIWVGESLKLGISSLECDTSTPVTGEELTLKTTVFNSESVEAAIKSVTYTTEGSKVIGADTKGYTIPAGGSLTTEFKFTPEVAKVMAVTATVVVEQDGKEYTFTKDITLDILNADDLVYIGIDAAHQNEYVAGNYKDSMGNFSQLAAGYSVRTVELKTSADLIAACDNDKYKAIILTAPSRRDGSALRNPYNCYSDEEIAALTAFNNAGGAIVLAGWSDYYESYSSFPEADHMAAQQNKLLAALGSSLRIADDGTNDDSLNGGQTQRLYFNTYNNDSFLVEGVEVDSEHPNDRLYTEVFSHYGGASIYVVDAEGNPTTAIPDSVSPVVYGHTSTYSKNSDGVGFEATKYAVAEGDSRLMIMATEQLAGKGLIVVSGAAFMSNFEVQATVEDSGAEKNYSNYKICENLVQYINPISVTPIAEVQKQTETGYKYTIEGVVTTNASGYDKNTAFFDCIYVQDETGGVCCFPVAGEYKIGDKVRVTGTTDFYQGEMELQVTSIQKIGEAEAVTPAEVTAAQINDGSVLGQFITIKGIVESVALENGLVQTIMVKDAAGDVARVFIDGYICSNVEIENLKVGCEITVSGVSSFDDTFNAPEGPFPRIRINDRANIVCGAVVEDPFTDIAGSGYHDYIVAAANAGIINGYPDNTFKPKAEVTRAQFITMLYRSVGSPAVTGTLNFADKASIAAAYQDAVIWGVENGIIAGYGDNTFRPNQNITRAQMATFIYRYLKNVEGCDFGVVPEISFADKDSIASPYVEAVSAIVSAKIMNGTSATTFAPNATANRGMAATVIFRVYASL